MLCAVRDGSQLLVMEEGMLMELEVAVGSVGHSGPVTDTWKGDRSALCLTVC